MRKIKKMESTAKNGTEKRGDRKCIPTKKSTRRNRDEANVIRTYSESFNIISVQRKAQVGN